MGLLALLAPGVGMGGGAAVPYTPSVEFTAAVVNRVDRKTCVLVEVDVRRCWRTYADASTGCGVAVTLGGTGDLGNGLRCDYSYHTCQARATFDALPYTFRWLSQDVRHATLALANIGHQGRSVLGVESLTEVAPMLAKASNLAQQIDPEGSFTRTEKFDFSFTDYQQELAAPSGRVFDGTQGPTGPPIPGFNLDKAVRNTGVSGSWWRRWRAMFPNFRDLPVRVLLGSDAAGFTRAMYHNVWAGRLVNAWEGDRGSQQVSARDIWIGAEKQVPAILTKGNSVQIRMGRSATVLRMRDASELTDISDSAIAFSALEVTNVTGTKELMRIVSVDYATNDVTVERGWMGTPKRPIAAGADVAELIAYLDVHPVDAILDLSALAGVPSPRFDLASREAARAWIGPVHVSRIIRKPTQARTLIFQLLELFQGFVYVDEDMRIKLFVNRPDVCACADRTADTVPPPDAIATLTDDDVLHGSGLPLANERSRLTHVVVYFDFPSTADTDSADPSPESSQTKVLWFNAETYDPDYYGDDIEAMQLKSITSAWIRSGDYALGSATAARWGKRYARAARRFEWRGDLSAFGLRFGSLLDVAVREFQDAQGARETLRAVVVKKELDEETGTISFIAQETGIKPFARGGKRYAFIGPNGIPDYDAATTDQRCCYGWIASAGVASQLITDTFTRANEAPLAAPWTRREEAILDLTGNLVTQAAQPDTPASAERLYTRALALGTTGTGYVQTRVRFSTAAGLQDAGVVANWSASDYWVVTLTASGAVTLGRKGYSYAGRGSVSGFVAGQWYTLRLEVHPDHVRVYVDGAQVLRRYGNGPVSSGARDAGIVVLQDNPTTGVIEFDDFDSGTLAETNVHGYGLGVDRDDPYCIS